MLSRGVAGVGVSVFRSAMPSSVNTAHDDDDDKAYERKEQP